MIVFALSLRLLKGFETEALAQEPRNRTVATQVAEINAAKQNLSPKVKVYLGDKFLNADEYASLKKGIEDLISKLKALIASEGNSELAKIGKEEVKTLEQLLNDLKLIFEEDTAILASAPNLNVNKWWGKTGIFKTEVGGKLALCFVVYNPSKMVGTSRTLAQNKAREEVRKYLGAFGWAKMKMQMEFHEDEKKGGSWVKAIVPLD